MLPHPRHVRLYNCHACVQTPSGEYKIVLLDEAAAKGERPVQLLKEAAEADQLLAEAGEDQDEVDEPAAAEVM